MNPRAEDRPAAVTFGVFAVAVTALLLIARAFDTLGGLNSLATRERLRSSLDSGMGRRSGVTVADLTAVLHTAALIAGGAATVALVLALFVITGNRGARFGLTAAGGVAGVAGLMVDPLLGLLLAAGALAATVSPAASAWYAGKPLPQRPEPSPREERPDVRRPTPTVEPHGSTPRVPPPTTGFGQYRPYEHADQFDQFDRVDVAQVEWRPVPRPEVAPATVRAAVVLTWAICLAVVAATVAGLLALRGDRVAMVAWVRQRFQVSDLSVSAAEVTALLAVALVVIAGWAIGVAVLALLVRRGHAAARIFLILNGLCAVAGTLALLTGDTPTPVRILDVVVMVAAAVVSGLLLSTAAGVYFGDARVAVPRPRADSPPDARPGPGRPDDRSDADRLPPAW